MRGLGWWQSQSITERTAITGSILWIHGNRPEGHHHPDREQVSLTAQDSTGEGPERLHSILHYSSVSSINDFRTLDRLQTCYTMNSSFTHNIKCRDHETSRFFKIPMPKITSMAQNRFRIPLESQERGGHRGRWRLSQNYEFNFLFYLVF